MKVPDDYIQRVLDAMPRATPLRSQIALELRGDIAERLARGQSMDDVCRQLGDPKALAESYLADAPLKRASVWRRVAAKLIDVGSVVPVVAGSAVVVWFVRSVRLERWWFGPALGAGVVFVSLLLPLYTAIAEYWVGCTFGKWILDLRVVRESGARMSLGQSFVRQLSFFGQLFLIDALFVLFTMNRQRALELASKTRVIQIEREGPGLT